MFNELSLFVGAFLDALIGPNLFVPGEPFLIAAGYQLQQGIWAGVFVVLLGGFLGDQVSYWIGRYVGVSAQKKLIKWQSKTRRPVARCRHLMHKKGNYVLAFARLLGPIAWVVPFIAGTNKVTWGRFTVFGSLGLLLGVGQFVMWGFLLGYGVERFPILTQAKLVIVEHQLILISTVLSAIFLYVGRRLRWRLLFAKFTALFFSLMIWANYSHFFFYSDDFAKRSGQNIYQGEVIEPNELAYKVYPGISKIFDAQAMNVLFIGDNPRSLMLDLGWIENQTFSRNEIEWKDYIQLLKDNTPPVSDLFWNNQPQKMAFQLPGDLLRRSHIRWWQAGVDAESQQTMWVGALSYDDGLQLTPYAGIVTVLHSVDPNVDHERDKLAKQVSEQLANHQVELTALTQPIVLDEEHEYYTDGRILVIRDTI
ncbi:LssY C-terminal domain-containing protein [Vibrio sp. 404]|uniref:LssY C-terminal domain-containing protein n=1 Tax=Vibrio marinisediminis TaxID=2758441 RepID=A0A7W2ISP0_9VIBR|nr:LssY C-terminal domain-containing protein [Vibrio marinisediminis]MBA5761575.1 LssY C-terminal domain-containing protein [Vibrio marinisediminis]